MYDAFRTGTYHTWEHDEVEEPLGDVVPQGLVHRELKPYPGGELRPRALPRRLRGAPVLTVGFGGQAAASSFPPIIRRGDDPISSSSSPLLASRC